MKMTMRLFFVFVALGSAVRAADGPADVVFAAEAASPIANGVGVPAGRTYFWTSGTVPSVVNKNGATTYERYGDTYAQGVSALKNVAAVLAAQGLTLKDVVYLRVYVAPDAAKGPKPDFPGWFKAYGEFSTRRKTR